MDALLDTPTAPLIDVAGLDKHYQTARGPLRLFSALNLRVDPGQIIAIVGRSGAGKSTLLHLLGALDHPSAGRIQCAGVDLSTLDARQAARFRNRQLGYVWQFHYLLPEFTALENVALPLMADGISRPEALRTAAHWLAQVELSDRADHRPGELSGGEQQRVALARALVHEPRILLADEPTGDLDESTAELVFQLLLRLHRELRLTAILVTHNLELAARCHAAYRLEGGKLIQMQPLSTVNTPQPEKLL